MTQPIIAYGRVEPDSNLQIVGRRHQRASIKKAVGRSKIIFEVDVATGGSSLKNRPALVHQLHQAHRHGVPLIVEAVDRIISTYSRKRIKQFIVATDEVGVQVDVAHIDESLLRRIRKIVAGSKPVSRKRK